MPIKYRNKLKKTLKDANIGGIPIIFSYKYLGITINSNGSIEEHLINLEKRLKYLKHKIMYN